MFPNTKAVTEFIPVGKRGLERNDWILHSGQLFNCSSGEKSLEMSLYLFIWYFNFDNKNKGGKKRRRTFSVTIIIILTTAVGNPEEGILSPGFQPFGGAKYNFFFHELNLLKMKYLQENQASPCSDFWTSWTIDLGDQGPSFWRSFRVERSKGSCVVSLSLGGRHLRPLFCGSRGQTRTRHWNSNLLLSLSI